MIKYYKKKEEILFQKHKKIQRKKNVNQKTF